MFLRCPETRLKIKMKAAKGEMQQTLKTSPVQLLLCPSERKSLW